MARGIIVRGVRGNLNRASSGQRAFGISSEHPGDAPLHHHIRLHALRTSAMALILEHAKSAMLLL